MIFVEAGKSKEIVKTYNYDNIHSIKIKSVSAEIKFKPQNKQEVTIEYIKDYDKPDKVILEIKKSHKKLSIKEHFLEKNINGHAIINCYIPSSQTIDRIECVNTSGSVFISNIKLENIKLDVVSGSISINNLINTNNIKLHVVSGSVSISNLNTNNINADVTSGSVSISNIINTNNINVDATSGSISMNNIKTKDINIGFASGDITLDSCKIYNSCKFSYASGDVDIGISSLPFKSLNIFSESGSITLKTPTFGDNFKLITTIGTDQGILKMPFECEKRKNVFLKGNNYPSDQCIVEHGEKGPVVKLSTYRGDITIISKLQEVK